MALSRNACSLVALPDFPEFAQAVRYGVPGTSQAPDGVWLALDPERMAASLATSQEGREAFREWKAWWVGLTPSERNAINKGLAAAGPPTTSTEINS